MTTFISHKLLSIFSFIDEDTDTQIVSDYKVELTWNLMIFLLLQGGKNH